MALKFHECVLELAGYMQFEKCGGVGGGAVGR